MRNLDHEQFDNDQSRRVAEALVAAASAGLPAPSASLRETVELKLIQQEDQAMVRAKQTSKSRRDKWTPWWAISFSICLLVGMGAAVWLTREQGRRQVAEAARHRAMEAETRKSAQTIVLTEQSARAASLLSQVEEQGVLLEEVESTSPASPDVTLFSSQPPSVEVETPEARPPVVVDFSKSMNKREITRDLQRSLQGRSFHTADEQKEKAAAFRTASIGRPTLGMLSSSSLDAKALAANNGAPAVNDIWPRVHVGERPIRGEQAGSTEEYDRIRENTFLPVRGESAVSTFSIDVDTASYSNVRRFLTGGALPPVDAVRIEELVNYFHYDYPQPEGDAPFSADMELAGCPWNEKHRLLRVGLKGKEIQPARRPAANLVFLLDVSGSMQSYDKLPLLQQAMKLLVGELRADDRVSIVTYAGSAGLALDSTAGGEAIKIRDAIDRLRAGGSTNGSAGIVLAYEKALENFVDGGINRVILATDGDLNVGVTDDGSLVELIKQKAANDVFLTVLGFGTGNLKDTKMEKLADNGNGNYAYIDSLKEARKVLVEQINGSLVTIAKDVKLQLEFNPAEVRAYRLIGYENRLLATEDFDDDTKDAGEIGAGHTVTALYELVPAGSDERIPGIDEEKEKPRPLKYQTLSLESKEAPASKEDEREGSENAPRLTKAAQSGELLTLLLRYKQPEGDTSTKLEFTLPAKSRAFNKASQDLQFAAAVASFGMLLRNSRYAGDASFASVEEIAAGALGADKQGRRQEFVDLVQRAEQLSGGAGAARRQK